MLQKKFESILITGGTGSFGRKFVECLLNEKKEFKRIVVFSRDELKQWEMQSIYPNSKYPQMRYFLGDIRDKNRLTRALKGIDVVVHAAALKQVPASEYNPGEFIKTNVLGAQNLIEACMDSQVKKVIALSTDKASAPINLYGATKLCSDKLFIAANNSVGKNDLKFSVVRYGNVMGSRGSVFPLFLEKAKDGELPITSREMTRFNISLRDGIELVYEAIYKGIGGEIFVPKIPSYRVIDVAEAIAPNAFHKIVGIRSGEKIHEEMINSYDASFTYDLGNKYIILPRIKNILQKCSEINLNLNPVSKNFSYNSGTNEEFLTIEQIRKLIIKNIDSKFQPY